MNNIKCILLDRDEIRRFDEKFNNGELKINN